MRGPLDLRATKTLVPVVGVVAPVGTEVAVLPLDAARGPSGGQPLLNECKPIGTVLKVGLLKNNMFRIFF